MRLILWFLYLGTLFSMECFGGGEITFPQAVFMGNNSSMKAPKNYGSSREHVSVSKYEQGQCPICLDNEKDIAKSSRVYLPCAHMVCKTCHQQLEERQVQLCPLCRKPFKIKVTNSVAQQTQQNMRPIEHYRCCPCELRDDGFYSDCFLGTGIAFMLLGILSGICSGCNEVAFCLCCPGCISTSAGVCIKDCSNY